MQSQILTNLNMIIGPTGQLIPNPKQTNRPQFLSCNVDGITITTSGTENSSYQIPNSTNNDNCLPASPFTGIGNWTGIYNIGTVTYTFSQPITSATVGYSAVNGNDVASISTNSTSAVQLSNPCGLSIIGANIIDCNYAINSYGDVTITVSSVCPFTTITLTNVGGRTGWVTANPCNFLINPVPSPIVNCPKIYLTSDVNSELCYHATQAQTTTVSVFDASLSTANNNCDVIPCTINGVPCSSANVTIEPVTPLPYGCTFNTDGTVTIPAGTLPFNTYNQYYYKLRSIADPSVVSQPYRVDFGISSKIETMIHNIWLDTSLEEYYPSGSYNILTNSSYNPTITGNCDAFVPAMVTGIGTNVTILDITTPLNPYYRVAANGSVVTQPGVIDSAVPYGHYELKFKMCDATNPAICITGRVIFAPYYANRMVQNNITDNIIVAPNPSADGIFNLTFDKQVKTATIEVYSLMGQKVYATTVIDTKEYQIILDRLPIGIYSLKIDDGNETITKQIIK